MNKFVISFKNEGAFDIKTEMNASDVLEKLINSEEWVELEGHVLRKENIEAIFNDNE